MPFGFHEDKDKNNGMRRCCMCRREFVLWPNVVIKHDGTNDTCDKSPLCPTCLYTITAERASVKCIEHGKSCDNWVMSNMHTICVDYIADTEKYIEQYKKYIIRHEQMLAKNKTNLKHTERELEKVIDYTYNNRK
jgi:hypothetical protein